MERKSIIMSIKEISRRCVFNTDDYGISGIDAINAEIVIEDDGKKVFLLGQWSNESGDYYFETTYISTFDLYEKMLLPESDCDILSEEIEKAD